MTNYKVAMVLTDSFHNDIDNKNYKYGSPNKIDDKSKPIILYYFLDDYERVWDEGNPITYDDEKLKNNASVTQIDYTDKVLLITLFNFESFEETSLKFEVGKETSIPEIVDENDHSQEYKFTPTKIVVADGLLKDTAVFNEIISSVWEGYYSKQKDGEKLPKVAENVQNAESHSHKNYKKCAECSDSVFGLEEEICFECSSFGAETTMTVEHKDGSKYRYSETDPIYDEYGEIVGHVSEITDEQDTPYQKIYGRDVTREHNFYLNHAESEDCEVCYTTVDKGTLNDVQAGRICNECHRMNQYDAESFNAEGFEDQLDHVPSYAKIYCSNCKKESPDYHYSCINCGSINVDADLPEHSRHKTGHWISSDNFPELYEAETFDAQGKPTWAGYCPFCKKWRTTEWSKKYGGDTVCAKMIPDPHYRSGDEALFGRENFARKGGKWIKPKENICGVVLEKKQSKNAESEDDLYELPATELIDLFYQTRNALLPSKPAYDEYEYELLMEQDPSEIVEEILRMKKTGKPSTITNYLEAESEDDEHIHKYEPMRNEKDYMICRGCDGILHKELIEYLYQQCPRCDCAYCNPMGLSEGERAKERMKVIMSYYDAGLMPYINRANDETFESESDCREAKEEVKKLRRKIALLDKLHDKENALHHEILGSGGFFKEHELKGLFSEKDLENYEYWS